MRKHPSKNQHNLTAWLTKPISDFFVWFLAFEKIRNRKVEYYPKNEDIFLKRRDVFKKRLGVFLQMPRRFLLYWLIYLNARNQEEKSEFGAENQLVECFWFFEGYFLFFWGKYENNTSEYLTSHFQDCIFANGNKRSILGDYLKNLKNNPRKAWQVGFQNYIFATGNTNPKSALNSFLHLISYLLISTNILPLPR